MRVSRALAVETLAALRLPAALALAQMPPGHGMGPGSGPLAQMRGMMRRMAETQKRMSEMMSAQPEEK